jgi:hypothetical protein
MSRGGRTHPERRSRNRPLVAYTLAPETVQGVEAFAERNGMSKSFAADELLRRGLGLPPIDDEVPPRAA